MIKEQEELHQARMKEREEHQQALIKVREEHQQALKELRRVHKVEMDNANMFVGSFAEIYQKLKKV